MTRLSSSFARERELIIVGAEVSGPAAATEARLVRALEDAVDDGRGEVTVMQDSTPVVGVLVRRDRDRDGVPLRPNDETGRTGARIGSYEPGRASFRELVISIGVSTLRRYEGSPVASAEDDGVHWFAAQKVIDEDSSRLMVSCMIEATTDGDQATGPP